MSINEKKFRPLTMDELALSGATHARDKRTGFIGPVIASALFKTQFMVCGVHVTPSQALADYELGWPGRGWGPFGVEVERATVIRKKAEPFGIE